MNYWMTEERRKIVRRYIFDMINSFIDDLVTGMMLSGYNTSDGFVLFTRLREITSVHLSPE